MDWKPKKTIFPSITTEGNLKQAVTDISNILQQTPHLRDINLEYGDGTNNAWDKLADMLAKAGYLPQNKVSTSTQSAPHCSIGIPSPSNQVPTSEVTIEQRVPET